MTDQYHRAEMSSLQSSGDRGSRRWFVLATWAAIVLAFGLRLGDRGLYEPDEARYAEIAREMVVTGDWIVPRLEGVPHYAKPPLTYWAIATSMSVFGINELAVRLPAFLAGLMLVGATGLAARRLGTRCRVDIVPLVTASMVQVFILARAATPDILLAASVAVAWMSWLSMRCDEGNGTERHRWAVGYWMALGVGFLAKGPVVLLWGVVPIFVSTIRDPRARPRLARWWGPLLFLAVVAPWFVAIVRIEPRLPGYWLGHELFERVTTGVGRRKPWWFLGVVAVIASMPWTWIAFRGLRDSLVDNDKNDDADDIPWRGVATWAMLPLLALSFSAAKLWTYVLPAMPAFALLASRRLAMRPDARRLGFGVAVTTFVVFHVVLFIAERRVADIGRGLGFRAVAEALPDFDWRGVPVPRAMRPGLTTSESMRFTPGGVALMTYRFRFLAAEFHALRGRAEIVPNYGGPSLWEIAADSDHRASRPFTRERLAECLGRDAEPIVVVTKAKFRDQIEALADSPLIECARIRHGNEVLIALTNTRRSDDD